MFLKIPKFLTNNFTILKNRVSIYPIAVQTLVQKGEIMETNKLSDVAKALGISVTTVSRALSGKGRVSESTALKVRAYIKDHGYSPNKNAQALAMRCTFTIGILVPMDAFENEAWFFHKALIGAVKAASSKGYDTIVSLHDNGDSLTNLTSSNKADGYILLRSIVDDVNVSILSKNNIPFAVIGNCGDEKAISIECGDEKHAVLLTEKLLEMGAKSFLLILGDMSYRVNMERKEGVLGAAENVSVISDVKNREDIEKALDKADEFDAVIAGDDIICFHIGLSEKRKNIKILSSLYPSPIIKTMDDVVTSEGNNPSLLGERAACLLIERINNRNEESGENKNNTEKEE